MRQQTFKRGKEKGDVGLAAITAKNQQLSADYLIAQRSASDVKSKLRSQVDGIEDYAVLGIRDAYSGVGICQPRSSRTKDRCYGDFKTFVGPSIQKKSPHVVVKSDAAPEITGAVYDLGWHPEPSLANKWPSTNVGVAR